ncbi:MAG TPA: nuclease A inhibitor family protein, partial [Roseiflexaceae bacterium]|nr:nuclease A inhibitor family protein [Roseiflexaceae bacterium]
GELPRLRGLDREAFVRELHAPGGGAVGRVAGIGEKALAALRAAIPAPDRAPTAAPAPGGALAAIAAAAQGLLVPSESDYPLVPFRWEGQAPLTPAALLAHLGLPPDTPVETRTLEAFFDPLARTADWMDEGQRAQAARFAALRDLIAARLRDVVVYRVGRVRITVLIAGQDAAGATVGLRTTLIET